LKREKENIFIHLCDGNIWPLLDMIVGIGLNGFHPFQPNRMDIVEVYPEIDLTMLRAFEKYGYYFFRF